MTGYTAQEHYDEAVKGILAVLEHKDIPEFTHIDAEVLLGIANAHSQAGLLKIELDRQEEAKRWNDEWSTDESDPASD